METCLAPSTTSMTIKIAFSWIKIDRLHPRKENPTTQMKLPLECPLRQEKMIHKTSAITIHANPPVQAHIVARKYAEKEFKS